MLHTPQARFARLFVGASSMQAGAIDAVQQAQTFAQVMQAPVYGPPAPPSSQLGLVTATSPGGPPPGPNAPRPAPLEPQPRGGEGPVASASGMSTTTKIVIGVAAFGAVYLLLRSRGGG
jgi:hypothetical protein